MAKLDDQFLERTRRDNPTPDADMVLLMEAVRDCAIAYFWNPIVSTREFAYVGWSTRVYAGIDDRTRTAHVVFRGTDQAIDWVVNLAFVPLPLHHPLAHGGFIAAWKLAKRHLVPWLRAQREYFDCVVVAGHSLGGALALACAYELQCEGFEVKHCFTVGAPRVYTAWSAATVQAALAGRVMRMYKRQDVVPRVPPALSAFRHVGIGCHFAEDVGDAEPEPFPLIGRWLQKAWYYFQGAQVGQRIKARVGPEAFAELHTWLLTAIVCLGGVYATMVVEVSFASLMISTLVFVLVSAPLVALRAHQSRRYTSIREAASLVQEWKVQYLGPIPAGHYRKVGEY